jgi:hypothetical protein
MEALLTVVKQPVEPPAVELATVVLSRRAVTAAALWPPAVRVAAAETLVQRALAGPAAGQVEKGGARETREAPAQ